MTMLRIALPNKGRLAEETRELFNDAGLEVRARWERALTASLGGEFEGVFVRAQDIPEFVADGAADVGVTGWDLVSESGRDLRLARRSGVRPVPARGRGERGQRVIASLSDFEAGCRVATSFPRLASKFFADAERDVDDRSGLAARPKSRRTSVSPTSSSISCRPVRRCV